MSAETAEQRPNLDSMEEAVAFWATKLRERPVSEAQRERLISLLLD